jgi:hypothetical protein
MVNRPTAEPWRSQATNMQNKANSQQRWEDEARGTWGSSVGPRPTGLPRPVDKQTQSGQSGEQAGSRRANRAKRTQLRPGVLVSAGSNVRNKPNSAAGVLGASAVPAKSYGEFDMHRPSAKQSQFAEAGPASGGRLCGTNPIGRRTRCPHHSTIPAPGLWCETKPFRRRGYCAKQSQFPGGAGFPTIPVSYYSAIPSLPSTWTPKADCANNGGLGRLRSLSEVG